MAVAADLHRIPLSPNAKASDNGVSPDGLRLFFCRGYCSTHLREMQEENGCHADFEPYGVALGLQKVAF